ncbi:MAG: hypothetical protein AAGC99_05470 [Pseudomonadota bacterium]
MSSSPIEQRKIRLKNDHQSMVNIRCPWLQWTGTSGSEPYVERYELDLTLRSIVGPGPEYLDKHRISVVLPPNYPHRRAPEVRYQGDPKPFHPNWFTDGRWCSGPWLFHESLGQHIIRMIQTLQFDPHITDEDDPANLEAKSWYLQHKESGLFPCDQTALPDPTTGRLKIKSGIAKKTFNIKG